MSADLTLEVAELRARVDALDVWCRSVEARLSRHEMLLMSIQAEQRRAGQSIDAKLDAITALLKAKP